MRLAVPRESGKNANKPPLCPVYRSVKPTYIFVQGGFAYPRRRGAQTAHQPRGRYQREVIKWKRCVGDPAVPQGQCPTAHTCRAVGLTDDIVRDLEVVDLTDYYCCCCRIGVVYS